MIVHHCSNKEMITTAQIVLLLITCVVFAVVCGWLGYRATYAHNHFVKQVMRKFDDHAKSIRAEMVASKTSNEDIAMFEEIYRQERIKLISELRR